MGKDGAVHTRRKYTPQRKYPTRSAMHCTRPRETKIPSPRAQGGDCINTCAREVLLDQLHLLGCHHAPIEHKTVFVRARG
jgi:hypothetical protein